MRIAVVDNFQKDRDTLAIYLEEYMKSHGITGDVFGYPGGEEFLETCEGSHAIDYDMVFLDIYMNGMDGMNVARRIRLRNGRCCIIFVAGTDSFAIEGYKVQAFRYMLKPCNLRELKEVLDEYFDSMELCRRCLEIKEERINKKIYFQDIEMAELHGHYVLFYMEKGEIVKTRMTAQELISQMKDERFLECYRNLLVNLDYVDGVEDGTAGWESFRMKDGRTALIQKSRKKYVKQYFTDYLSNKSRR